MTKYCGKDFLIQRGYLSGGAWVGSTVYTAGAIRANSSKIYICTTGGTSASSGGPTTTSLAITDGTCVWRYISASVVVGSDTYGFDVVGNMTATSMSVNNEQVDVTDKSSVPWRQLQACGTRSMEMSCSGKFSDDFTLDKMVTAAANGTFETLRLISGVGDKFFGTFIISKVNRDGNFNDAEQYSMDFASAGDIDYTPAP